MDPRLASLIELQKVLGNQREQELLYNEIPKRRGEIEDILGVLENEIQAAENEKKEYLLEQKNREMELQQSQESRVKKEAQLQAIKTPKEYDATLAEIESLDRKNKRVEERMLELIDLLEKCDKRIEEKKKELEAKKESYQPELDELDKRAAGMKAQVDEAKEATDVVKQNISPELYQRFLRIFQGKNGLAVVPANGGHCGGCNIRLTPRIMQLAKRGQDIVTCEGCARFLYWDSSLEEDQFTTL